MLGTACLLNSSYHASLEHDIRTNASKMLVDEVLRFSTPLGRDAAGGYIPSLSLEDHVSDEDEDDDLSTEVSAVVALRPRGDIPARSDGRPSFRLVLWQAADYSNYTLLQFIREEVCDVDFRWLVDKCDVVIQLVHQLSDRLPMLTTIATMAI